MSGFELARNSICNTCLSVDRKLYLLKDLVLPLEFQDVGLEMEDGRVCWECRAIINKVLGFKNMALQAQEVLSNILKLTELKALSKLTIHNNKVNYYDEIVSNEESEQFDCDNGIKCERTDHDNDEYIKLNDHYDSDSNINVKTNDLNQIIIKSIKSEEQNPIIDLNKSPRKSIKVEKSNSEKDSSLKLNTNARIQLKAKKVLITKRKLSKRIKNDVSNKLSKEIKKNNKFKEINIEIKKNTTIEEEIYMKDYVESTIGQDDLLERRGKQKLSAKYKRGEFRCENCILPFRTEDAYKQHMTENHSEDLGTFVCDICLSRFSSKVNFENHHKQHYTMYRCRLCKHKNYTIHSMNLHMKNNHTKLYTCNICKLTFNSKGAFRYHMKTHNLIECKLCGKSYVDIKIHMQSHKTELTEQCHICKRMLKSKTSLRFHLLTHEVPRKDEAYCAECDVHFKNKFIYRLHLKNNYKHGIADKECDYCHRKFINKFSLSQHIHVIHFNKHDHVCHLCGKGFSIAGHLRNHIQIQHEGRPKPRIYVCNLCGKDFAIKKCLTDHMNSHTGARPYKCEICLAQFGYKSALYMHNRLKHLKGKKGKITGKNKNNDLELLKNLKDV